MGNLRRGILRSSSLSASHDGSGFNSSISRRSRPLPAVAAVDLAMIKPEIATIIIIVFIALFGVILPILNRRAPKYVSYRWCVVVVILALLIGSVIDFGALPDDARQSILVGGLVIVGAYIVLRTVEKALANGWLRGASIEASKGDISVKVKADDKK